MKPTKNIIAAVAILGSASISSNAAVLFFDNFDVADNTNFSNASTAGRLSGTQSGNTYLSQWGKVAEINNNQAFLPTPAVGGDRGLRFENATNDPVTTGPADRFDWAAGTSGASILADGGFVVTFDWIPLNNNGTEWISYQVGTINSDSGNLTNDDYGILFRNNGGTQRFAADPAIAPPNGGSFTATAGGVTRQVEITYTFSSFADGSAVNAVSKVNGTQVASDTFNWNGNSGEMRMELGTNFENRIDNLMIATIPEPSTALLGSLACLALLRRRR